MTQRYRDRVAARPGYARLKNRKKELRRRAAAGADPDLIDRLWRAAEDAYRRHPTRRGRAGDEWHARRELARRWAAGHAAAAAECGDETCAAATAKICVCRCGGVNHGRAR